MNLKIGTVIRWDNFPSQRFGSTIKARWFICLGFSGIFAQIATVYLSTTTTQLQYFKDDGKRSGHSRFIFETKQFPLFEQDCAIDFDEPIYPTKESLLNKHSKNIEIRGELKVETMRMLYKRFSQSPQLSRKVLLDIHDSYNKAGITGLKKPKK